MRWGDPGPGLRGRVYRTSLSVSSPPPPEVFERAIEAREGLPPGSVRVRIADPVRDLLRGVHMAHRAAHNPHNTNRRDPGEDPS